MIDVHDDDCQCRPGVASNVHWYCGSLSGDRHRGPHLFDDLQLALPTPKRKLQAPKQFEVDHSAPQVKQDLKRLKRLDAMPPLEAKSPKVAKPAGLDESAAAWRSPKGRPSPRPAAHADRGNGSGMTKLDTHARRMYTNTYHFYT